MTLTVPPALRSLVAGELAQPVPAGAHALATEIRARHGSAVQAIVFYGSCLRKGDDQEGLLDLYALVDSYRSAYSRRWLAVVNRLLPPNVFYLQVTDAGRVIRCKYAVLALGDLRRVSSKATFEPYFWARFAQPCALVYAGSDAARRTVVDALATAVATFIARGIPLLPASFDARTLWTTALRATYRSELRAERPGAVEHLYGSAADRYETVTRLLLTPPAAPAQVTSTAENTYKVRLSRTARYRARTAWGIRRWHGKALFLLRIGRNALTFENGVDYVLWKIQRHSGVAIDSNWRKSRHPLLALGAEAWRLYRAGAFR